MSSEQVGAYNPSVSDDGKTLYYTVFDELGFEVAQRPNEKLKSATPFVYQEPTQMEWQDETPDLFVNQGSASVSYRSTQSYKYDHSCLFKISIQRHSSTFLEHHSFLLLHLGHL